MSVRRNGSAVSSLVHRMGETREPIGRPASPAGLRSDMGPVLVVRAMRDGVLVGLVSVAMVKRAEQPAAIAAAKARLALDCPGAVVEEVL